MTYNFAAGQMLAGQEYTNCFRREQGKYLLITERFANMFIYFLMSVDSRPLCLMLVGYRDNIYQCMMSTQELVGIHNDSAHKSWSKYATDIKVGKVN